MEPRAIARPLPLQLDGGAIVAPPSLHQGQPSSTGSSQRMVRLSRASLSPRETRSLSWTVWRLYSTTATLRPHTRLPGSRRGCTWGLCTWSRRGSCTCSLRRKSRSTLTTHISPAPLPQHPQHNSSTHSPPQSFIAIFHANSHVTGTSNYFFPFQSGQFQPETRKSRRSGKSG